MADLATHTDGQVPPPVLAVPRPVRWESDGACRCPALLSPWGGRTTHYRSQCQTETTGVDNR
ncbi:MAG TPA: hypothetical protein VHX38_00665 [Pseudonocardiaceae bacterium]|jgi:hypothetical protein|nr:hypothetical protein [Pseudonocardiaceae bacterium]